MQVSLEQFEQWQSFRRAINACPLAEIVWTRDGKPIEVPSKLVAEFLETGLSNCMFPEIAGIVGDSRCELFGYPMVVGSCEQGDKHNWLKGAVFGTFEKLIRNGNTRSE